MKNGAKNIRVESRLAELFTHLGLERAHFGVQNSAELDPIIAARPDLIASLAMGLRYSFEMIAANSKLSCSVYNKYVWIFITKFVQ